MFGSTSYFQWTFTILSSNRSNSSDDSDVQKRPIRRAISRRAAATASILYFLVVSDRLVNSGPGKNNSARCRKNRPARLGKSVYRFGTCDEDLLVRIALEQRLLLRPAMR